MKYCAYLVLDSRIVRKQRLHFDIWLMIVMLLCLFECLDLVRGE